MRTFECRSRFFFWPSKQLGACGSETKRVIFHGGFLFIIDLFFATQLGFEDYIKTHVGKRGIFGSFLLETTSPQKMLRGGLK